MSLSKPHPMWQTANTSYKVNKCVVVSRMLSGRFRCGSLLKHFYTHLSGICDLCSIEQEDLPHILVPRSPKLYPRVATLVAFAWESLSDPGASAAAAIFEKFLAYNDDKLKVQFLLDPSVIPEVIAAEQSKAGTLQQLMNITTTWCYSINKLRIKLQEK